ncbi:MAG: NAD(P)/FAD-dependent oxidoreductase [Actinobacteria bacterium]|nr:NAD(P)/FAD-dependent oxidoreductase [Actinomycetota bacterium]
MARILIAGGGYVGLYAALGLEKKLGADHDITMVTPHSYMTYQPFLPEAASGSIEPRHVVVPLRLALKRTRVVTGRVLGLDHPSRTAILQPEEGPQRDLSYDHIVIGMGSVSRVLDVPGVAEQAVGFTSIEEAIYLRNRVLSRLDVAESATDPGARQKALTFTFVGGGYSGIEALAELEDLARDATRYYPGITSADMRWVLVEASPSILPEVGDDLAAYATRHLRNRGIDVRLETRLVSAVDGHMVLSDGTEYDAGTLVWTTGVVANPVLKEFGFPTDDRGRIVVDEYLRVTGHPAAWAAGDGASIPDVTTGRPAPPTAQHALREARLLARNLAAEIKGGQAKPFCYTNKGGLVSLGRYKGVAKILDVKVKGFPAWFLHRTYHVFMLPGINRKFRVLADWTIALFFRRDIVQLGSLGRPRSRFRAAAGPKPK